MLEYQNFHDTYLGNKEIKTHLLPKEMRIEQINEKERSYRKKKLVKILIAVLQCSLPIKKGKKKKIVFYEENFFQLISKEENEEEMKKKIYL